MTMRQELAEHYKKAVEDRNRLGCSREDAEYPMTEQERYYKRMNEQMDEEERYRNEAKRKWQSTNGFWIAVFILAFLVFIAIAAGAK